MLGMFCILAGRWVCLGMCGRAGGGVDAYMVALQGNLGLIIAHHSVARLSFTVSQRREDVPLLSSFSPSDAKVREIKNGRDGDAAASAGHFH